MHKVSGDWHEKMTVTCKIFVMFESTDVMMVKFNDVSYLSRGHYHYQGVLTVRCHIFEAHDVRDFHRLPGTMKHFT